MRRWLCVAGAWTSVYGSGLTSAAPVAPPYILFTSARFMRFVVVGDQIGFRREAVSSSTGLTAETYTGHVTLTGGGTTKTVTVVLSMTSPTPVQHKVSLSWKGPGQSKLSALARTARPSRVVRTAFWRAPSAGPRTPIRARNRELLIATL
jgi:hypothetical protein